MITVLLLLRLDLRLLVIFKITVKDTTCADPRVFCGFMSPGALLGRGGRACGVWGGRGGDCGRLVWGLEVYIHTVVSRIVVIGFCGRGGGGAGGRVRLPSCKPLSHSFSSDLRVVGRGRTSSGGCRKKALG